MRFIYLMPTKLACLLCLCCFSFSISAQSIDLEAAVEAPPQQEDFIWPVLKKSWDEDIQFHGFLSQGLFHTTGNNVYGKSKNSVSADLTELGLNISYQALNKLSFAVQGLYRRAGKSTGSWGEAALDFAFIDFAFFSFNEGRVGLRGGRIKNPWGFYNETRDVAATHPTIFLPLVYFDRSRALYLALDGGQIYADYNSAMGNFGFKLNYGVMNANDADLLAAITLNPDVKGHLKGKPSLVTQLSYESGNGQYAFALSYAYVALAYRSGGLLDPYAGLKTEVNSLMFSGQYNGEKLSLVGEYNVQWNRRSGIIDIAPDDTQASEYWYVQAGYRILDNLQATIRYDSLIRDTRDRSGQAFHQQTGLPAHLFYTQDIVVGLSWNLTPAWLIRAEYSRVYGTETVSLLDNPDLAELERNWNIYALQVAYRF